ncbi:hypothetical protein RAS12_16085 [Achromobacter seleniivolatilans]|uniref:Uncharacterized protein n=1 Tax=Achromobacter seleniivolatilans TaxID=3047478 RepID=A0ABY9LTW4_9BURK|nr:hypothetical protein [Achromobacter sp. R39]WMD18172.1 hypothetical protein RAS12_16085 [Achromobacter sp. R39]
MTNTHSPQDVEERLAQSHPSELYVHALQLFEQGRKDEAVKWFFAGQLRFRYLLIANPGLPEDDEPAAMDALNATVGSSINEWAAGEPNDWADAMQAALDWDARYPNPTTPKDKYAHALEETRAGLASLIQQIRDNVDMIREQRTEAGLENR